MTGKSRARRGMLAILAIVLALGCGDEDRAADDALGIAVSGTRVRIRCFGGDCFAVVIPDDQIGISVRRTIDGVEERRSRNVPRVTDVEVEMGGGNDHFRLEDYSIEGTLRIAMGDGDDSVHLFDGSSFGGTLIDLGPGDDHARFEPRLAASWFRVDAGPGDDEVVLYGACFPRGNVMLGGPGNDRFRVPSDFVPEGGYAAGFEAPEVFEATTELCPDLE